MNKYNFLLIVEYDPNESDKIMGYRELFKVNGVCECISIGNNILFDNKLYKIKEIDIEFREDTLQVYQKCINVYLEEIE